MCTQEIPTTPLYEMFTLDSILVQKSFVPFLH